jgi:hypothetical protein
MNRELRLIIGLDLIATPGCCQRHAITVGCDSAQPRLQPHGFRHRLNAFRTIGLIAKRQPLPRFIALFHRISIRFAVDAAAGRNGPGDICLEPREFSRYALIHVPSLDRGA